MASGNAVNIDKLSFEGRSSATAQGGESSIKGSPNTFGDFTVYKGANTAVAAKLPVIVGVLAAAALAYYFFKKHKAHA